MLKRFLSVQSHSGCALLGMTITCLDEAGRSLNCEWYAGKWSTDTPQTVVNSQSSSSVMSIHWFLYANLLVSCNSLKLSLHMICFDIWRRVLLWYSFRIFIQSVIYFVYHDVNIHLG